MSSCWNKQKSLNIETLVSAISVVEKYYADPNLDCHDRTIVAGEMCASCICGFGTPLAILFCIGIQVSLIFLIAPAAMSISSVVTVAKNAGKTGALGRLISYAKKLLSSPDQNLVQQAQQKIQSFIEKLTQKGTIEAAKDVEEIKKILYRSQSEVSPLLGAAQTPASVSMQ